MVRSRPLAGHSVSDSWARSRVCKLSSSGAVAGAHGRAVGVAMCAFPESRCYERAGLLCLRALDCSTIPLLPKPGVLSFTWLRVETSFFICVS